MTPERSKKESPATTTVIPVRVAMLMPKAVPSKMEQHQRLLIAEKIDFTEIIQLDVKKINKQTITYSK